MPSSIKYYLYKFLRTVMTNNLNIKNQMHHLVVDRLEIISCYTSEVSHWTQC